jgi:hypothetical protein
MIGHTDTKRKIIAFTAAGAVLAGCAQTPLGPTVQVMPGPGKSFDVFQADQSACKVFAADQVRGQAEQSNQRAVGAAVLTTVLGAGLGAAVGGGWGAAGQGAGIGAATGAATGTAIGANMSANDQYNIQVQYDNSFSQCMYAKGEMVPGYAPVASASASAPVAYGGPDPALVRSVQSELVRLSYLQATPDGVQGPRTRSAIQSFERSNGMAVDGTSSTKLLAKLQATPTGQAAATASAPSGWVAPAGTPAAQSAATPAATTAPAGWVAPTKSP